jgi:hypothetical protein
MSRDSNDLNKPEISGTSRLLEQNRILNEVIAEHGENRAMFAFALSLSEKSNTDYQPDDARRVRTAINTMMHHDLEIPKTAEFLRTSQESLNQTIFSEGHEENDFITQHVIED